MSDPTTKEESCSTVQDDFFSLNLYVFKAKADVLMYKFYTDFKNGLNFCQIIRQMPI